MAVASVSTITSASPNSWQEAAELGFERARQTLRGITGIKVVEEKARVEDGAIIEFLVTLQVIFLLEEEDEFDPGTSEGNSARSGGVPKTGGA